MERGLSQRVGRFDNFKAYQSGYDFFGFTMTSFIPKVSSLNMENYVKIISIVRSQAVRKLRPIVACVVSCSAIVFIVVGCCFLLSGSSRAQDVVPPAKPAVDAAKPALIPMPREVQTSAILPIQQGLNVSTTGNDPEDEFIVDDLVSTLKERGIAAQLSKKGDIRVVLLRATTKMAADILSHNHIELIPAMHDEGYAVITGGNTMYDIASTSAGLFYGAQTIKQLITGRESNAHLQGAIIRDWPAMKYRGVSDDLSRGPVSTLDYQKHQIRVMAEYKMNVYSPYFEVSLAYAANPLPAPFGGAMTRADVESLVGYAKQYHIILVPEQEAFGHLHHALMFESYSDLAETPHGSSLAPGQPGSSQLIQQWFTEIAAMFPGPFIHIGADEVNELGLGQSKQLVDKQGSTKTYIDFLNQIHSQLQPLHKKLLFWGDIAMNNPELVKDLPKDMIAVAWEYGPRPEGFEKWIRPFSDAGMETWVSPGINDWGRVYPNNNEGLLNIQGFARDGQRLGSTGILNTVWNAGEDNEGFFNNDWYGVLFGAAAGWQAGTSDIPQFQDSYGEALHGDMTGKINQAQMELTAAQLEFRKAGYPHGASTDLFWSDPWSEEGQLASAKVLPVAHEIRMHAERAINLIKEAEGAGPLREMDVLDAMELGARRVDFIAFKFQAAHEIAENYDLAYSQQNGKRSVGSPLFHIDYLYEDLIYTYGQLHDMYQHAWLQENRPYALHNVMVRYDLNMQLWMQRSDGFRDAKAHFNQTHTLVKPEDIGLPAIRKTMDGSKNTEPITPSEESN